jgi:lipopolysaccharide transport system permease protein
MYFAGVLQNDTHSLVEQQRVITKVYFPRLAVPLSAVISGLLDFAISFVVFMGMMLFYRVQSGKARVAVPGFLVVAVETALGVGLSFCGAQRHVPRPFLGTAALRRRA